MGSDLLGDIRREIEARLAQLRPAVDEYERLLESASAVDGEQAAGKDESGFVEPGQNAGGVAHEAILGALEHGSHTVPELVVVTGEGTARINRELRRLAAVGAVAKTEREGKLAWSLATGD